MPEPVRTVKPGPLPGSVMAFHPHRAQAVFGQPRQRAVGVQLLHLRQGRAGAVPLLQFVVRVADLQQRIGRLGAVREIVEQVLEGEAALRSATSADPSAVCPFWRAFCLAAARLPSFLKNLVLRSTGMSIATSISSKNTPTTISTTGSSGARSCAVLEWSVRPRKSTPMTDSRAW